MRKVLDFLHKEKIIDGEEALHRIIGILVDKKFSIEESEELLRAAIKVLDFLPTGCEDDLTKIEGGIFQIIEIDNNTEITEEALDRFETLIESMNLSATQYERVIVNLPSVRSFRKSKTFKKHLE